MTSVGFHRRGNVAEIRLDRPAVLNAIDDEMERLLADAWDQVNRDPTIWVAVLSGAGDRAFCAGADMHNPPTGHDGLSFGGGLTGIGGMLRPLRKPLVCAVHGHVMGLGFELAMCADIIVAADDTIFRLPEVKAGIIEHCGVVHRAVRQLPYHVAMGMIIASAPLQADDALRFGLVNECVEHSLLDDAIKRWLDMLLACSPLAAQAAKEAACLGLGFSLPEALGTSYQTIELYQHSKDYLEALTSWRARRTPEWKGK